MRPAPVPLSALSQQAYEAVAEHTAFPWPIFTTQCRRHSVDPANLGPTDLKSVLEDLVSGVTAYTSPAKGQLVRQRLVALLGGPAPH